MRFTRHARIFRGPLDPAPVAAVLMLLMMLILLDRLVYTPGVLVKLGQTIAVTSSNAIVFAGQVYPPGELEQLRADLKNWPDRASFNVTMESGADPEVAQQVSNLFQITLPDGTNLAGTDNATVVVAVNFRGQCFYEYRMVQDQELQAELSQRVKMAARDSKRLTMILLMDKAAEIQVLTRLEGLARAAGIAEVLRAERPEMFGPQP